MAFNPFAMFFNWKKDRVMEQARFYIRSKQKPVTAKPLKNKPGGTVFISDLLKEEEKKEEKRLT
jgi:hypothetical protein